MSENLILGPEARRRILCETHLVPGREVYLRELVRHTGLALRTVHQEVNRLVNADLLSERRDGNRRYLSANDAHPLFRPIREIVLKTDGLAHVLRDALGNHGVEFAFVFGSIASDTPVAGSDVDLLVVGDVGLRATVKRLANAQDTLGREINPVVWTCAEFRRRRRKRDHFLTRVLEGPRVAVLGEIPDAS
ncbi:MAG: nucleotidyltransferase domain-containing protein [Gemmatimonadetes bacterium]|nr:nucleotidyltransferase domain-containing protein [Gemmatimonadota bacterium]